MLTLLHKLSRTRLLTPAGLFFLGEAILTTGINLMALLRLAAKLHPQRTALVDEHQRWLYPELWHQAETLAIALHHDYGIQRRHRVAIACRNHGATIKTIFACSRLGAHVYLLNPEMSSDQILALAEHLQFNFWVYDGAMVSDQSTSIGAATPTAIAPVIATRFSHQSLPAYHPTAPSIDQFSRDQYNAVRLPKVKTGNLVVMTGGTTGPPKAASRKPSILNFLPPFLALLSQVHLDRYRSVYIATPIYHGFGVAALLMGVILGLELHVTARFDAQQATALIARENIEGVTLVPLMLQRMLNAAPELLASLRCLITGGAPLSPGLAQNVLDQLGPILFNLYGTSEAGFCIMATPDIIARKSTSIGKPILGVRAKIVDEAAQVARLGQIGRLWIRSAWTTGQNAWIETGDLAYCDAAGDLFLCGRGDDMIVSGGENVYPVDLENVLLQHPAIEAVAVIGIPDVEFGQRLKAVVQCKPKAMIDHGALLAWLKPRVARYQMPAVVEFRETLPYTALGKLDKKSL
jgi:fatty-acyl-CoA synthase